MWRWGTYLCLIKRTSSLVSRRILFDIRCLNLRKKNWIWMWTTSRTQLTQISSLQHQKASGKSFVRVPTVHISEAGKSLTHSYVLDRTDLPMTIEVIREQSASNHNHVFFRVFVDRLVRQVDLHLRFCIASDLTCQKYDFTNTSIKTAVKILAKVENTAA